jgi:death-on-curing protein
LADYFQTKREGIAGVGPRSLHLFHSAVSRQWAGFGGRFKWNSLTEVAATLFFGIIRNHSFIDANKRTALLTALYQLQCHGRIPAVSANQFEDLTVNVAERALANYRAYESVEGLDDAEVLFISKFFRSKTREVDKRHYVINYRELDQILRNHGAWLEVASQNTVSVMRNRVVTKFFRKQRVSERVLHIGFHDWGSEVSRKDIMHVRKALDLTHDRGIDSQVFYKGVDPVLSLIQEYKDPLERLAFK